MDGDKDDDLDAEKLAQLLRGGYVKEVHQVDSLERAVFKQQVALYHHRVRQRVRESLRLTSLFRQHGVMLREKAYVAEADRPALQERLPADAVLRDLVQSSNVHVKEGRLVPWGDEELNALILYLAACEGETADPIVNRP